MNSAMNGNFVLTGAVVVKFGVLDFKPQFWITTSVRQWIPALADTDLLPSHPYKCS